MSDTQQQIVDWFKRANDLLSILRNAVILCEERISTHYFAGVDPEINEQQERKLWADWNKAQETRIKLIRENGDHILATIGQLGELTETPAWERFRVAYAEIGDFVFAGVDQGWAAFGLLQTIGYQTRDWALQIAHIREAFLERGNSIGLQQAFNDKLAACPLTHEIEAALRKRLLLEESRIVRDLETIAVVVESQKPKAKASKINVNDRMLGLMQRNSECHGWTCQQWAEEFKCSTAAITKCQTWKKLQKHRLALPAGKALDRRRKPKGSDRKS